METKKKINPIILILVILLITSVVFCCKFWNDKKQAEKLATEYKTKYDTLIEGIAEAKTKENEYQAEYNQLVRSMLADAANAEKTANLVLKVWHNAIYKTSDKETDKYTMIDGQFVSDFNVALSNLFKDKEYISNTTNLYTNQQQIKSKMKNMVAPPKGFENAFKALENLYNSYISFTNTVLHCEGSYNSFSEDFIKADDEFNKLFHSAELYIQ